MAKKGSYSELAKRYARALFEVAKEQNLLEQVAGDLDAAARLCLENAEVKKLNNNPSISRARKYAAWVEIAKSAKFSAPARRLIEMMAERGRIDALPAVARSFASMLLTERNMVEAKIISAEALTAAQTEALSRAIEATSSKKPVLKTQIDASLLGGVVIHIGSQMIDRSLKGNLDRLKLHLKQVIAS